MELLRVSRDLYGQEVLQGVSWDLLPVAAGLGAAVIVGHAVYRLIRRERAAPAAPPPAGTEEAAGAAGAERIERHLAIDRLFHWLTALAALTLLGTGFLPVLGVKFGWVTVHWIAGVVLVALVLFHLVRSLIWQSLSSLWISAGDLDGKSTGKYSLSQKLMHHAMTLMALGAAGTGLAMLAKVNTPWWQRNPYLLGADTWGGIYVVHGMAALCAVTLVIVHVYFGVIPQNRMYLRAMIRGWMTRREWLSRHPQDAAAGSQTIRR